MAVGAVVLFLAGLVTILGGVAGMSLIGQVVIAAFVIMFLIKILMDR